MNATADLLWCLIEKGWMLRTRFDRTIPQVFFCYRSPGGISGDDYESTDPSVFPPAVTRWILDNVLMAAG